jgi:hypothetical protein
MLVTVCLIILAIPGALVLHEMMLPKIPSVGPAAGSSPLPFGSSPIADSPAVSSPPPAASSAPPTSPPPPTSTAAAAPTTSAAAAAPPSPTALPSLASLDDAVPAALPGYVVSVAEGGRLLGEVPTLDMCAARFASESKRAARLEVNYSDNNGQGPTLEVVMYAPGGAALAYTELVAAVKRCPASYHDGDVLVTKTELEPGNPSFLPTQLTVTQSADIGGETAWTSTIYQFEAPYLVAVYSDLHASQAGALQEAGNLAGLAAIQLKLALTGSTQPIISG